ncbi:MAG TPA: RNA 2',3'-cyclic phosphodiesterase [Pseudoneobacillus sp.]|nr:RNA 2',3'-cyclic phosphodiesterase [Pseudoneobacillus sp.]
MTEKTHYFLAVRLPDSIKKALNETIGRLQNHFSFQRWVHPEDYHITLAFLGFANENQINDIKELVPKYIQAEKSFSLTISQLGIFGMKTSPRIFWAGLNESKELQTLRNKVYFACEQAGFQLEKRAFHPHITLARKWSTEEAFHPVLLESTNVFREAPLIFHATDVVLYKTNLLQTPKYENLITFSLHS